MPHRAARTYIYVFRDGSVQNMYYFRLVSRYIFILVVCGACRQHPVSAFRNVDIEQ